jgi:hypothetical protein
MYKRTKNTVFLDLKFIQNKGFSLNVKDIFNVTLERISGFLLEINKNITKRSTDNELILHNLSFLEILKMIELEKYWNDVEKKENTLNIKGDCLLV